MPLPLWPHGSVWQMAGQLVTSLEWGGGLGTCRGHTCAQKPLTWQPAQTRVEGWAWWYDAPLPAKNCHGGPVYTKLENGKICPPCRKSAAAHSGVRGTEGTGVPSRLMELLPTRYCSLGDNSTLST